MRLNVAARAPYAVLSLKATAIIRNVPTPCGVNRVARVLRRVSCAAMRDGWNWRAPCNARPSNIPIVLIASVCVDLFQAFGREPVNHAHQINLFARMECVLWVFIFMPVIGSLVSALLILRVSRIVACCLLTRVRNATLGLLRIVSTIIGIVARCRVVRRCRLCALSFPICVDMIPKVMTAGVLMACFMRPSVTLSRRSSRLRPPHVGVWASDSLSLFV